MDNESHSTRATFTLTPIVVLFFSLLNMIRLKLYMASTKKLSRSFS